VDHTTRPQDEFERVTNEFKMIAGAYSFLDDIKDDMWSYAR
jgi:hypothetical protein